jgi:hypothetical protein
MRTIGQRFWALFRRGRLDRELSEEIGAHLAMQEEEFRQQGMDPAAARAAARRAFGGVAQTCEAYRERRGIPWLETAAKDVRYALRGLGRNPRVLEIVRHFAKSDKPIAAICHAAQLLAAAGVLAGKSCSCYPAVAPDVAAAGGKYVEVAMDQAHTCGKLVTAPAWPAHPAWLSQFLRVLGTRIEP